MAEETLENPEILMQEKKDGHSGQAKKGFTLAELMLTVLLFTVMTGAVVLIFRSILVAWSSQEARAGVSISLDSGMEKVVRDLRGAREILSTAGYNEFRFTQDQDAYSIYYLYNADDSYVPPPAFNQGLYQLRKATLSGGINGTFTYGSGELILFDVVAPGASALSFAGNLATIDLSVLRKDETLRSRTQVRPRNL